MSDLDGKTEAMKPAEIRRHLALPSAGQPGQHRQVTDRRRVDEAFAWEIVMILLALASLVLLVCGGMVVHEAFAGGGEYR